MFIGVLGVGSIASNLPLSFLAPPIPRSSYDVVIIASAKSSAKTLPNGFVFWASDLILPLAIICCFMLL